MGPKRCQQDSILLLGPVRYARKLQHVCKHSARFASSDRMEESTGGRGGRSSSDWAASKRLPFPSLPFSKIQIFDQHVFYSNLLEKCIGEAPDAFLALLRHSLRKIILPKGFLKGIGAPKRGRSMYSARFACSELLSLDDFDNPGPVWPRWRRLPTLHVILHVIVHVMLLRLSNILKS